MDEHQEVWDALRAHLKTIYERDPHGYRQSVTEDLVIYEWYVTPNRQDGVGSHLFFIENTPVIPNGAAYHYELLTPKIQRYGDVAVVCYTLMMMTALDGQRKVTTMNETRVLVKHDGRWRVSHVHKSPTAA